MQSGFFAGLLPPSDEALRAKCCSNLKAIGQGLHEYAHAHATRLPQELSALVDGDYIAPDVFLCPGANEGRKCDYFYQGGKTLLSPPGAILVCDLKSNHDDGRSVLFLDAHVEWMMEEGFQAALAKPENADFAKVLRAAEAKQE